MRSCTWASVLGGVRRDDRAGAQRLDVLARAPVDPQAGERERLVVRQRVTHHGCLRPPGASPTRRSRRRRSGSDGAERRGRRAFVRIDLRARVDELEAQRLRVLGPVRDEAPAQQLAARLALAVGRSRASDVVAGRDVVARAHLHATRRAAKRARRRDGSGAASV